MKQFLVGTAILIFILFVTLYKKNEAGVTHQWLAVDGRILERRIVEDSNWRKQISTGIPNEYKRYLVIVRYEYFVGGARYIGDRERFHTYRYRRKNEALKRIESFRVGQSITVYVDPKDASSSVLHRD